jgi:hypothetical protein
VPDWFGRRAICSLIVRDGLYFTLYGVRQWRGKRPELTNHFKCSRTEKEQNFNIQYFFRCRREKRIVRPERRRPKKWGAIYRCLILGQGAHKKRVQTRPSRGKFKLCLVGRAASQQSYESFKIWFGHYEGRNLRYSWNQNVPLFSRSGGRTRMGWSWTCLACGVGKESTWLTHIPIVLKLCMKQ